MADTARVYEIYLPLDYRGGTCVEQDKLDLFFNYLKWRFRGLTICPPGLGFSSKGEKDRIVIARIFTNEADDGVAIMDFAKCVARDLVQDEVLVTYWEVNIDFCRPLPG